MELFYEYIFPVMWIAYIVYWRAMAEDVKVNERIEPAGFRLVRAALMLIAILLLLLPRIPVPFLNDRFVPQGLWTFWCGVTITAGGLLFSIWGRRHLGRNWSRSVTVKQDHELITSGPYAFVRHPIYTGLLTAFAGSALARGQWGGVLAVVLVFVGLWQKLTLEEKWMREQFGRVYERYCEQTKALVPFVI